MPDFPVVISFYTKQTPYEEKARSLAASCQKYGLEYVIEGIDSFGTWELNDAFKPFYIYQKLHQLQRPVLWVDADDLFYQKPVYLELFSCDIAVQVNADLPDIHPEKVLTSAVYVNYTPPAIEIVRLWAKECMRHLTSEENDKTFWDGAALRDVLANQIIARVEVLPAAFLQTFRRAA